MPKNLAFSLMLLPLKETCSKKHVFTDSTTPHYPDMFSSTESSVAKLSTIWHRNWQSGKLEVTNKRIKNNISVDITLHILQTQIVEESLICFLPNKIWRRWIDGNLMSGWRRPQQASTLDHIGKIPYTIDCIYTRKAIYMILWLQFFFLLPHIQIFIIYFR